MLIRNLSGCGTCLAAAVPAPCNHPTRARQEPLSDHVHDCVTGVLQKNAMFACGLSREAAAQLAANSCTARAARQKQPRTHAHRHWATTNRLRAVAGQNNAKVQQKQQKQKKRKKLPQSLHQETQGGQRDQQEPEQMSELQQRLQQQQQRQLQLLQLQQPRRNVQQQGQWFHAEEVIAAQQNAILLEQARGRARQGRHHHSSNGNNSDGSSGHDGSNGGGMESHGDVTIQQIAIQRRLVQAHDQEIRACASALHPIMIVAGCQSAPASASEC